MTEFNLYCDESCHLEHDMSNSMSLGTVIVPKEKRLEICRRIVEIKQRHGIKPGNEVKWTTARPAMTQLYLDLIDYFFDDDDMRFRGLVVPDKNLLDHAKWGQTHDTWYYKMYFDMLKTVFTQDHTYNVYVDIKDTHSAVRIKKLNEVCCNNMYDFKHEIIRKIQPIRSDEVQIMQLTDILVGAICRVHRHLVAPHTNKAKQEIISRIIERSRFTLNQSTLPSEKKFNLFVWRASR